MLNGIAVDRYEDGELYLPTGLVSINETQKWKEEREAFVLSH